MFTSRGQKADRPVTPNGYSFVLKIQERKRVLLLGINLVLGTVFFVELDCWYAINTALLFSGVPRNFVQGGGGVQQIQLRTEDIEKGDMGTLAP